MCGGGMNPGGSVSQGQTGAGLSMKGIIPPNPQFGPPSWQLPNGTGGRNPLGGQPGPYMPQGQSGIIPPNPSFPPPNWQLPNGMGGRNPLGGQPGPTMPWLQGQMGSNMPQDGGGDFSRPAAPPTDMRKPLLLRSQVQPPEGTPIPMQKPGVVAPRMPVLTAPGLLQGGGTLGPPAQNMNPMGPASPVTDPMVGDPYGGPRVNQTNAASPTDEDLKAAGVPDQSRVPAAIRARLQPGEWAIQDENGNWQRRGGDQYAFIPGTENYGRWQNKVGDGRTWFDTANNKGYIRGHQVLGGLSPENDGGYAFKNFINRYGPWLSGGK